MLRTLNSRHLPLAPIMLWIVGPGAAVPAGAQPAAVGIVEAVVGEAVVTRQETTEAQALTVGAELFEGDRIRTAAGGRLRLRLSDARCSAAARRPS